MRLYIIRAGERNALQIFTKKMTVWKSKLYIYFGDNHNRDKESQQLSKITGTRWKSLESRRSWIRDLHTSL